jgi:integrase
MVGNIARTTLALHMATAELLAEFVGWERKMDEITPRDIEGFRARRLRSGIRASTANKEVKILRRLFHLAALRGYVRQDRNPCVGIPMLRVGPTRPRYISREVFGSIYSQATDTFWRAFLVVMYTTGLRLREAMHLLWRDVDLHAGRLHVTRRAGIGLVQAWTPKDHEMRSIPLPPQAISLLATLQGISPRGCPYVFLEPGRWEYYRSTVEQGRWGPHRDLANNQLRRFQTLCRRAGVEEFTVHDLRRSCITNWAKKLPIHVVQQLAGHSDIQTTRQFYLSVQAEDMARAQALQAEVLAVIPQGDLTDPKLTHFAPKRAFPGRQGRKAKTKALD